MTPIYKEGNCLSERRHNLPEVSQPTSGELDLEDACPPCAGVPKRKGPRVGCGRLKPERDKHQSSPARGRGTRRQERGIKGPL